MKEETIYNSLKVDIEKLRLEVNSCDEKINNLKWYSFIKRNNLKSYKKYNISKIEGKELLLEDDKIPGMDGPLVDLFEKELTEEEWSALKTVHEARKRLNCSIRFDWSKSIDVKSEDYSQIIDEEVLYKNSPIDEEEY